MHLIPEFGYTINNIIEDGFKPKIISEMVLNSDSKTAIAKSIGLGIISLVDQIEKEKIDFFIVLGDRFEVFSASIVALHSNAVICHIHGGDQTSAVFDDYYRHGITKLSQVHFTATLESLKNVLLMGANPNNVYLTGSPAIDEILKSEFKKRDDLGKQFEADSSKLWCLMVYHPIMDPEQTELEIKVIIESLKFLKDKYNLQVFVIYPNTDSHGQIIIKDLKKLHKKDDWIVVNNLNRSTFLSVLKECKFMIGNSSSGLTEAYALNIPDLNIGKRQMGRVRGSNVIDIVEADKKVIVDIATSILSKETSDSYFDINMGTFGDGTASEKIYSLVKTLTTDRTHYNDPFFDNSKMVIQVNKLIDKKVKSNQYLGLNATEIIAKLKK